MFLNLHNPLLLGVVLTLTACATNNQIEPEANIQNKSTNTDSQAPLQNSIQQGSNIVLQPQVEESVEKVTIEQTAKAAGLVPEKNKKSKKTRVCNEYTSTGSRLAKRRCKSPEQLAREEALNKQQFKRGSNNRTLQRSPPKMPRTD